jgi:hypothetical protein
MKESSKKNPAPIAPTGAGVPSMKVDNASAAPSANTKLMKKKNTAAGDPTKMAKPSRTHVKATSGARYGVRVKFQKQESPEAGATQGNGRLFPSAIKRSAQNFGAGMGDHN